MIELVQTVLTPAALAAAIAGGLGFGWLVLGELIQSDRFGTATAAALHFGLLVGLLGVVMGLIFYAGQIASALADHDQAWPRAAARYGLWIVFSIATGIGTWLGLRREWHAR